MRAAINKKNQEKANNKEKAKKVRAAIKYPADCRKIAAVDSNKHNWDWKNRRYRKKYIF